MVEERQN